MVKVQINDKSIYYDGYLKSNLEICKEYIKKDWDMVFIVDGIERGGKSVIAQQMAFFVDPTLTPDRICFSPSEFRKAILKAEKYQAVIYDEAMGGLGSRQALNFVNVTLINMLAEIGQKNLYVFIVLPCFFELDKYPAVWRSRALIHVYDKGFQRGYFNFYAYSRKKDLYLKGKKFYEYKVPPDFKGRFANQYCIDEKIYRAKKLNSLSHSSSSLEQSSKTMEQRDSLIRVCYDGGWTPKEIAQALNKFSECKITNKGVSSSIKKSKQLDQLREIIEDKPKEQGVSK